MRTVPLVSSFVRRTIVQHMVRDPARASFCKFDRCTCVVLDALPKTNRFPRPPQETVVCGVGYDSPGEILTAYRAALDLRPYMDELFLSQVQEVRRKERRV